MTRSLVPRRCFSPGLSLAGIPIRRCGGFPSFSGVLCVFCWPSCLFFGTMLVWGFFFSVFFRGGFRASFAFCAFAFRLPSWCFWLFLPPFRARAGWLRRRGWFPWVWVCVCVCGALGCCLARVVWRLRGASVWRSVVGVCSCASGFCSCGRAVWCAAGGGWRAACCARCCCRWRCLVCLACAGFAPACLCCFFRPWLAFAAAPCVCAAGVRFSVAGAWLGCCLRCCAVLCSFGLRWLGFCARPCCVAVLSVLWPAGCVCCARWWCWLCVSPVAFASGLACGGAVACAFAPALFVACRPRFQPVAPFPLVPPPAGGGGTRRQRNLSFVDLIFFCRDWAANAALKIIISCIIIWTICISSYTIQYRMMFNNNNGGKKCWNTLKKTVE